MKKKLKWFSSLFYILLIVFLFAGMIKLYHFYETSNFNAFVKTEYIPYTSHFTRDTQIRYSNRNSYAICSDTMNDAMFYKTVSVQPNTPYKVTCMIKTQNVQTEKQVSEGGAQICIADTVEKSKSTVGTTDWQEIEFIFNSKNRTSVDIGFRLGGYDDNCTGKVWFSDFTIEAGAIDTDNTWNFACFLIENTQVEIETNGVKKVVTLAMDAEDIQDMKQNMKRFEQSCQTLSQNKMQVTHDIISIKEPLTSLSYDEENGYYVAPANVKNLIESYLEQEDYDHIFIAVRLGDVMHQTDIPINDWIGLGGMEYNQIGFSNIRLPNDDKSYIYKYNERINTFPEEVFLHEFLHTLEKNAKDYGFLVPALHDYKKYGYQDEKIIGQKKWYQDYMNQNIVANTGEKLGLDNSLYHLKPSHKKNFEFSYEMDSFKEPQNIIEELQLFFDKIGQNINNIAIKKEGNER